MCNIVKNILNSRTVKTTASDIYYRLTDVFSLNPIAVLNFIIEVKKLPSAIRDGIFFECFEAYILKLNEYDEEKKEFVEDNLKKMAISLAEVSPNSEANNTGDPDKLHEYAKRILKLIDDCGTIQKAVYLANISRALAKHEIDKKVFFKLGQCIRMLTEEDLLFLRKDISEKIITEQDEYLDDFKGLGLIYDVNGGFHYSLRAFRLLKYALDYEGKVEIPNKLPERTLIMLNIQETTNEQELSHEEVINKSSEHEEV